MLRVFPVIILLFLIKISYGQTILPLLGYSSKYVFEKLKSNSEIKFIEEGDATAVSMVKGTTFLFYEYARDPDVRIMYLFKSPYYGHFNYLEKVNDNNCYQYTIGGTSTQLKFVIDELNINYKKTGDKQWLSTDNKYTVHLTGGKTPHLLLNFTINQDKSGLIEFKDRFK